MTRKALTKNIAEGVRYTVRSEQEMMFILRGLKLLLDQAEKHKPEDMPQQMAIIDVYKKAELHRKKYFN